MDKLLDILQLISDRWFAIPLRTWIVLRNAAIGILIISVLAAVIYGPLSAALFPSYLPVTAIFVASATLSLQLTGLFGMMGCLSEPNYD